MTTTPHGGRPFAILAACALAWILILSLALRYLLGAGASGGWLIVGLMLSAAGAGIVLLIKEFTDAIPLPEHFDLKEARGQFWDLAGKMAPAPIPIRNIPDGSYAEIRRRNLGLAPQLNSQNRRRVV